ncbi:galactose mutarotase [Aquincola sp. S2]|uniref:Aldose 1-epimerase n=1 Tax=Pseudaquabacterium terrae TaxID=2732868 RepID=A0ABX2ER23_9BURK|nr:aldose epimerase family protein [Aquabacterium terrae]NRF71135.1 galactose mutarotase [Aquabacterium terrae]
MDSSTSGNLRLQQRSAGFQAGGQEVTEYLLDAGTGVSLSVLDLGGIVTALHCPDRHGRRGNVVLGPARLDEHLRRARNVSSLVGRYAGRIAGGRFTLDGREVQLAVNEGPNTLHGGPQGFADRLWTVTPMPDAADGSAAIELALVSEHGDQGFPGRLQVRVRYTLTRAGEWRIDYHAVTDRPTVINLTHHAYWNLAGGGSIEDHRLTLHASRHAALDAAMIPQGLDDVAGTPLDFRAGRRIGDGLRAPHPQLRAGRGYDHFFELHRAGPGLIRAARLEDPASGRVLEIETTEPGVQFYSGNFLDGTLEGCHGAMLRQGDALCLETQHIGDAPNRAQGPSTVLRPGEVFTSTTVHRLSVAS